jgi:hypothetical protein
MPDFAADLAARRLDMDTVDSAVTGVRRGGELPADLGAVAKAVPDKKLALAMLGAGAVAGALSAKKGDGSTEVALPSQVIDMAPIGVDSGAYAVSDENKKRPAASGVQRAVQRGLDGENPIDELGVQTMLIKQLTKRIKALQTALAARKRKGK